MNAKVCNINLRISDSANSGLYVQNLEKAVREQAEDGRKFVEIMMKYFSSPVEQLQAKHFAKAEKRPRKKIEQYISAEGK